MNKTAFELQPRLLALIRRGVDTPTTDAEFNELALEVFAFQSTHNPIYRAYCENLRTTVRHWKEIPAVPTSAFKEFEIACFPASEAVAEFHTSGTTTDKPGRHFFKTLELYEAAILPNFAAHLLPDGVRLPMIILTPSLAEAPHSSLTHMMEVVALEFGARCVYQMPETLPADQPVFLLGTAFAFVHLFEDCESQGRKYSLPTGSRAMETGGFKGRTRAVAKPDLYAMFQRYLGIPTERVVNEYGMTELSTQFYDATLRLGRRSDVKTVPPWARVLVVNPVTGKECALHEPGLIRVLDLANLWSAMCLQTEDVGVAVENGFEIRGRAAGASVRGCSLTAEELRSR